jgi:hypothetical protein
VSVTEYRPAGPTAAVAVEVPDEAAAVLFDVVLLLDPQPAKTPLKPTTHTATTSLRCTNTATDLLLLGARGDPLRPHRGASTSARQFSNHADDK